MNLGQCEKAYTAILELSRKEMDYQTAHELVGLERELLPHVSFFAEKERELVEQYAAVENGRIKFGANGFVFKDQSQAEEYRAKHKELESVCVNVSASRKIKIEKITPSQLSALEGFCEFEVV